MSKKLPVTIETADGGYVLKTSQQVREAAKKTTKLSPGFIASSSIPELVAAIAKAVDAWSVVYDNE